jgi:PAS domain S-box-containing protein
MGPDDILDRGGRTVFHDRVKKWLSGGKPDKNVTYNIRSKDGRWIFAALKVKYTVDEQGKFPSATGILQDMTERQQYEQELCAAKGRAEQNQAILETIFQQMPAGIIISNASGSEKKNNQEMNRIWRRTLSRTENIDTHAGQAFHPGGREYRLDEWPLARTLRKGEVVIGEEMIIARGDNTRGTVLVNASPIRDKNGGIVASVVICVDISRLKQTEEALRSSTAKLEAIFASMNDAVFISDTQGNFVEFNDAFATFHKFKSKEECINTLKAFSEYMDMCSADGTPVPLNEWSVPRALAGQSGSNIARYLRRKDTGEQWVGSYSFAPLRDHNGTIIGAVIVAHDITELKKAEEVLKRDKATLEQLVSERTRELLKVHTELERSKRMADIGRLSSTIAHEMRNPLTAIRAAAYNIEKKAANAALARHLETINRKILEGDQIINNLLSFTRIKSVGFEQVGVRALLKDCIGTVSIKYAKEKIELKELMQCTRHDRIEADPTQLRMLFINVLDNAYQSFSGKTGMITVSVKKILDAAWEIAVTDTGEGIDPRELNRIFEPFYTTRARGTGLGLTVCKEIVDMHKGEIRAQSARGKGSTFTITLPQKQAR